MKFEYKSAEEIGKMSADEQNKYLAEKQSFEKKERETEIETATKTIKEDLATVKEATDKTQKSIEDVAEDVESIMEKMNNSTTMVTGESLNKMVDDFLTENIESIKTAFKSKNSTVEIPEEIVKAVGMVTTANGTLPVALPINYVAQTMGVPNVKLRRPTLLDHVNTFDTNMVTLPYVEAIPGEGDFAVVAEGGLKPQLDLDWVTRYANPQKFAGWIKVTEEVIEDIPRLRDTIINYLRAKHDLFKERQVYAFIDANAVDYVTGGGLTGSVLMPNILDVVGALDSQVLNTPNYIDEPDFFLDIIVMNPVDFFRYFRFAKDALGRPLYADGFSADRRTFSYNGYMFVSSTLVPVGEILGYDSSKIDVTTYKPYRVEIGWVNDDFIRNQFVILGESRGHIHIREHDKRSFIKATIADVIADIEQEAPVTP